MSNDSGELELGNYRVLHNEEGTLWMLGRGGYGTTYKAEHKHLGRTCALKVINDNLMRNNDAKRRFLQEAQAAALLDHPHIARIYDFGESEGVFYYAMTYCAGGDLGEFCKTRGPQPWSVVKDLALQILPALGTAHGKGLLHRDLKPSNIMLADDDGTVSLRLIDFGLVKVLEHHESASTNLMLTQEGSFMGNPLTASPEQLREEDLDERSDLFSFGVTLWYLLLGGSPFGGVATAELVHQRLSDEGYESMLPEDLDHEGKLILSKLLKKKVDDRFRNADEVIAALKAGVVNEPDTEACAATHVTEVPSTESDRDSQPQVVQVAAPRDWSEIWDIQEQIKKFNYGTYYACVGRVAGVPGTTLFVPDSDSPFCESVNAHAEKLVEKSTRLLSGFYQRGKLSAEPAYVSPAFLTGTLESLLHVEEHLNLQDHLPIFQQIATAVDESIAADVPGVELEVADVLLGLRDRSTESPQSEEEWQRFFQSRSDTGEEFVRDLEIAVLPKLVDSADIEEAMVTLGSDDLATNPIARFGGLLYRSISGMSVKQSAYLSPSAHVSTSNISEDSNRYLSEVISARDVPNSAMEMLSHLCELEGVEWSTEIIDATLAAKDRVRDEVTRTHASMNSLVDSLPPTPKKELSPAAAPVVGEKPAAKKTAAAAQLGKPVATEKKPDTQQLTASQVASKPLATISKKPAAAIPQAAQQTAEKKSAKSKIIIIASAAALLLVLVGGLGWFFLGGEDEPKRRKGGSSDDDTIELVSNPVTLQFANIATGQSSLPEGGVYTLKDSNETLLARFTPADGVAEVENVPADMFADQPSDGWPLTIEVDASGMTMQPIMLSRADFKDAGDDRWSCLKTLTLTARAYLDIEPKVQYNAKELKLKPAMLQQHIQANDPGLDWTLSDADGKLRVILPAGKSFPVKAWLNFPGMKELSFEFTKDQDPDWSLELAVRDIQLNGLGSFSSMKFVPDYSKLPQSGIKKALREDPVDVTAQALSFPGGRGKWSIPALPGKVEVTGASGSWSFNVGADTKFRVLTSSERSGSMEMGTAEFLGLVSRAERGDTDAQYELGLAYLRGKGAREDKNASTEWFRMAALQGDKAAQNNLGMAYEFGTGVLANEREAFKWYSKAAGQGYADAEANLAHFYQYGRKGVRKDLKKAEEFYLRAVKGNSARAMFNLAVLYGDDSSGMENKTKALELYHMASELGHPDAMFNLGWHYEYGESGVTKDLQKAIELYKKAAEKGSAKAKTALESLQ